MSQKCENCGVGPMFEGQRVFNVKTRDDWRKSYCSRECARADKSC